MKMKKVGSLLLAVMLGTSLMAGCGESSGGNQTNASDNSAVKEEGDKVTLRWYIPAAASQITPQSLEEVKAELNRQLEADGLALDLILVESGDYDQKMQMVMASNEEYDLCFTSHWLNDFNSAVNKGAYAPLNELLEENAPELLAKYDQYAWDAVSSNGEIYAVPNRQFWGSCDGYYVRKDLADKYDFDPNLEEITTLDELEGFFQDVKDGEKDVYGTYIDSNYKWGYNIVTNGFNELAGRNVPACVKFDDESMTVINQFETEEFKDFCYRMKKWNDNGYIRKDSATYALSSDSQSKDKKSGKIASEQLGYVGPYVYSLAKTNFGGQYEFKPLLTSGKYITTSGVTASTTAVGINSKHKKEAVKLLQKVNTDEVFYNTLLYGIEGKHYKKVGDSQVELIEGSGYGDGTRSAIGAIYAGDQYMSWTLTNVDVDLWKQMEDWMTDAIPSKTLGFSFNPDKVKTELANVASVISSDLRLLDSGSVDVDTFLPEFIEKLKKAGSDKIVEECQNQLDTWLSSKQ